jgi:hypothetical protein
MITADIHRDGGTIYRRIYRHSAARSRSIA